VRGPGFVAFTAGLAVLAISGWACVNSSPAEGRSAASSAATPPAGPPIQLSGGAPSVDKLLDEFLDGIERKDVAALHGLRLTKEEYTQIIVPGEVPKGEPPRQTFDKVNDVFWGMLNARSRYTLDAIVNKFGGRHYVKRQLEFTESPAKEWAWYTGHGEVRLWLWDEAGLQYELRTGWIAEVGGTYKFIGFNYDN
jgi:hypothetical protein